MRNFYKYILTLVAVLMVTSNAWGADCTYNLSDTPSSVTVVYTGSGIFGIKYYNFPNTTLCTLINSYGISKISFNMKKDGGTNNGDFKLQFYNGSSWEDAKDASGNSITWNVKNSNTTTVSKQINPNSTTGKASKFQIIRTEDTNFTDKDRYFTISDIAVVMAKTMSGSEEQMPFDDQVYNTTSAAQTREFTFSNIETGKSISITSNTNPTEFPAEITKNGDCTGSVIVSVKFKPSKKGTRTGQITVSGDCGSKTFTVTGNGLLATPTLTLKGATGLVDRTTDVTKPNYIDLGAFIDTYIGDGYKYEVVSSNSQYAHFVGDNFYATEKGEYTIHITSPAGDHYSDTFADGEKYRVLVITVRDKARPVYQANYTQSSADGMLVDGTIENAFTLTNVSNDAYFACDILVTSISDVNDGSGVVISYDITNNKIVAHNAGTATLQFIQTENNDYYGEESPEYTFTVSKHKTSFGGEAYSMLVDATQTANYTYINTSATQPTALSSDDFYYTIDNVTFTNAKLNKGTDLITFNPTYKQITACNAGTAQITLHQKETYKYTGATTSYDVTVNKYTPTFTWNAGGATYYYLSSINNIFSTTNNDFGYTIVSDNEHVAKVIDNTLHIYNVEETAKITVTQEENYKWNGKTETYIVNPVELNNHVTFNITETNHTIFDKTFSSDAEWSSTGGYRLGDGGWSKQEDYVIIGFTGIPDELSFEKVLEKSLGQLPGSGDCVCRVYESVDGNEWGEHIWEHSARVETYSAVVQLAPTTKFVKFYYNGTVYCNFRNIKVTELFQFAASPDPLDFGTESATGIMQTKQVVFEHANAGRETTVTIEGADAKFFSVSPTTIANTGRDLYGTVHLDVIFDNDGEIRGTNPYNAILVITDNAGNREEVALTGIRDGKGTPVFTWNPNNFPYYFNTTIANIAISSNTDYANCPLTFTTSDASIAEVKDGTLHIYQTGQEVTITVSQGENADYYAHTETFTFTPKSKPDLTVPFHVDGTIYTNAITVSDKCSWDEGNNQMKLGDGAWDDSKKTAILVFSEIPDKLSFSYATSYGLAVIEIGSTANPKWMVEESADGTSWNTIWEQSTNSTSWDNAEIQLSETTQYVRFSYDGNYAGYFRNINVTALDGYKYLRATDGQYLSRGNYWGTQAVVDAFGMACRITRYTRDNVNQYTQFRFVDNAQYLYEADNHELFTDHGTAANSDNLWQINNNGGILTIQSGNTVGDDSKKGYYVTLTDNVLALTDDASAATKWEMEDYTEHDQYIIDMLNRQAAEAAKEDFGADVNTLEKVRNRLKTNDFDIIPITITELTLGEQKGEYREESGTFAVYDQTIPGLEPGFYRLTVKALYRMSESDIAWQCKKSGLESVLAYAYANDVKYPIQSVYDSYHSGQLTTDDELRDSKYYSTTLESADKAFNDENRYLNDVYVYVEADEGETTGTLRYGIKNPSYVPGAWLAYEEITLTLLKRKEYIFEGTATDNPTDWHTAANWNRGSVPNEYHNVIIKADAVISEASDVYHMNIEESKKVTISATGGLTVGEGGVTSATDNSITIENNLSGVGYFRIDPSATSKPSKVTVNYTPNAKSGSPRDEQWQYVGAPGKNMNMSGSGLMIYHWSEQDGWLKANTEMQPFVGYALTRTTSATDAYAITAEPIYENQTITLTKTDVSNGGMGGSNLFVNSYLAPIDLSKFKPEDFSGVVDQTFYLFNSGSWHQWQENGGSSNTMKGDGSSAGQYYAITSLGAEFLDANKDQTTIPPMQGVYVVAGDGGGKINLNYEKHIYNGTATDMNRPMRAPQMHDEDFMRVRLQVNSENSGADRMYIIQHPECTKGYDNGYDAKNIIAANQANIYTNEKDGQMEISFANQIDSTWIGFQAGEDSEYTLTFSSLIGEEIYLYDSHVDTLILMTEEGKYTFLAQANSVNDKRFRLILRAEISEDINTSDDEWEAEARFWVNNKIVYIDQAPAHSTLAVYSASGLVMSAPYEIQYTPCTIDMSYLPNGVYILRLNNQAYKFVCK